MMKLFMHFQKMKVYKLLHLVLVKGNGMVLPIVFRKFEFMITNLLRNLLLPGFPGTWMICAPTCTFAPHPNQFQVFRYSHPQITIRTVLTHSLFSFCSITALQIIRISFKGYQNEVQTHFFLMQCFITCMYPSTYGWTHSPVKYFHLGQYLCRSLKHQVTKLCLI